MPILRAPSQRDADGIAGDTLPAVKAIEQIYNGTTFDRLRNHYNEPALVLAERTITVVTAQLTNFNARFAVIFLSISAVSGTLPTLDVALETIDERTSSGLTWNDTAGNSIQIVQKTATGDDFLMIGPGLVQKLTGTQRYYSAVLPRRLQIRATIGGTTPSFTYQLDVHWLY